MPSVYISVSSFSSSSFHVSLFKELLPAFSCSDIAYPFQAAITT